MLSLVWGQINCSMGFLSGREAREKSKPPVICEKQTRSGAAPTTADVSEYPRPPYSGFPVVQIMGSTPVVLTLLPGRRYIWATIMGNSCALLYPAE
jgi:hypothetical protein